MAAISSQSKSTSQFQQKCNKTTSRECHPQEMYKNWKETRKHLLFFFFEDFFFCHDKQIVFHKKRTNQKLLLVESHENIHIHIHVSGEMDWLKRTTRENAFNKRRSDN